VTPGPLSANARAELAALVPERRCDRLAEISALFHTAGTVHLLGRGVVSFHLDLAESAVARRAYSILKELRVVSEIRTYHRRSFDRAARTQLLVAGSPHAIEILTQAGVLGETGVPLDRPPGKVVARACCRSAYLRGAFLGAGSLSGPTSPHLEVRTPLHAGAAFVRSVASAAGVRLRVADRDSHSIAYAKGWEAIETYLSVAGASDTVLALEERALVAELRAEANRLANADHANLVRQSRSARSQLDAVRLLGEEGVLDGLAPTLQSAAELRRRHPSLSSRELAARAEPPVTKAAMAARLARLVALAGETVSREPRPG
jgi:DNA-binding protein WhiA